MRKISKLISGSGSRCVPNYIGGDKGNVDCGVTAVKSSKMSVCTIFEDAKF